MFKSAAEEIGEWADRCRRWARRAQSSEQRLMLQSWERLFNQAEIEAEDSSKQTRRLQHQLSAGGAPLPTPS
jgi:hypothetical protein